LAVVTVGEVTPRNGISVTFLPSGFPLTFPQGHGRKGFGSVSISEHAQHMKTTIAQLGNTRDAGKLAGTPARPLSAEAGRTSSSAKTTDTGFTVIELLVAMAIAAILMAMSVPVIGGTMSRMKMNSATSSISGAITKGRYRAIRNSDTYTLAITAPQNTYVVTDVATNVSDAPVPLPSTVAINGGTNAVYTYTFCPNGTVYGAGGSCTNNLNLPPALVLSYSTRQTNISVSTVGNVSAKVIH
jgi:prepilin-type N-terminal cleavage/methylation domain-containing protein